MNAARMPAESKAVVVLALAMALAAATILWFGRGTTFWIDGLTWVLQSPGLDLRGALEPHQGHLVFVPHLAYLALLEAFGDGYLPFRLLAAAAVLLTVGLLFVYLRRRVGAVPALAPCLVLLFFGADYLHVIVGNAFTVLLAVACGVAALLLLERRDRAGDLGACAVLCLGVLTYSSALAFLAGAAVAIGLREDRWKRAWIVAVPLLAYAAWWVWARGHGTGEGSSVHLGQVLLLPAWGFQSLSAVLSALTGLDYAFPGDASPSSAGAVLAVAALAGLGWRLRRGPMPAGFWAALTVVVALWCLGALTANGDRHPDQARYLYPGAVAFLLAASEVVAGLRWSRTALIALFAVAAAGLGTNLYVLHERGAELRNLYAVEVHAAFGALDLAGDRALPDFEAPHVPGGFVPGEQSPLSFPFDSIAGGSPTRDYLEVARRYGPLGYSPARIEAETEAVKEQVDAVLLAALGLELEPLAGAPAGGCSVVHAGPEGLVALTLPAGGAAVQALGGSGSVGLRRFADADLQPLGELPVGQAFALPIPADGHSDVRPWVLAASVPSLKVCPLK